MDVPSLSTSPAPAKNARQAPGANTETGATIGLVTNHNSKLQWSWDGSDSATLTLKEQPLEVEGTVKVVLPGTMFRVELDNKHLVLAVISGKMRKKFVRLTAGDRVKMEMSPYDVDKARITWRLR